MSEQLTNISFDSLDLEPSLHQGMREAGLVYCTPIQARALPLVLVGKDVQGQAQTGTGKTAAFLLATMNYLLRRPIRERRRDGDPRAVILAPTRELAVQIHKDAEVLGRYTGLRLGLVFGGTGYDSQRRQLEAGVDILIGTPGRLIDYFKQRVFSLDDVQVVVLDEADRMFDLGFIRDIRYLLRRMPPPEHRLNLLFSATLSLKVQELAYEHMNAPAVIDTTPPDQKTVDEVTQCLYHVSKEEKIPLLLGLLARMDATRTMVFTNTKRMAEKLADFLDANGYPSALLTGDVPQNLRLSLLERFKSGDLKILVATDVAARGLHINDVSHVFNYDMPQDPEDYVHRVGRTARAGATGDAVSFACEEFVFSLADIESFLGEKIPVLPVTDDLLVRPRMPPRRAPRERVPDRSGRSGGGGRRGDSSGDGGRGGRGPRRRHTTQPG